MVSILNMPSGDHASRLIDLAQQCNDPGLKNLLLQLANAWWERGSEPVKTENDPGHLAADIVEMLRRRGVPAVVVDPKHFDDMEGD
jgi:hypothetical protein